MEFSIWSCGKSKYSRHLSLCLEVCSDTIIGGRHLDLLRKIYLMNKVPCNMIYKRHCYVKIMLGALRQVNLEAFVDWVQPANFMNQRVT